jgi:methyl-accepting chemotaxis protein
MLNNYLVAKPIIRYFKKLRTGETISDEEYIFSHRRFLSLPYYHSFGAFFRWVAGLSGPIIAFIIIDDVTVIQQVNFWLMVVINAPLGAVLYFLLTELYIQKITDNGFYQAYLPDTNFKRRVTTFSRLTASVTVITLFPFLTLLSYFLITISTTRSDMSGIYRQTIIIGLIGLTGAFLVSYVLNKTIIYKIKIILDFLRSVGEGDLNAAVNKIAVSDELTLINISVYKMKERLRELVQNIAEDTQVLQTSNVDLTRSAENLNDMAREQAAIIEEASSSFDEMASSYEHNLENAGRQQDHAIKIKDDIDAINFSGKLLAEKTSNLKQRAVSLINTAETGKELMDDSVRSIQGLSAYVKNIEDMIGMINDIADKINLLALNAAIEAARAGDAGRGFAVVADEINKLADQTSSHANEIRTNISEHSSRIGAQLNFMNRSLLSFNEMKGSIEEIAKVIDDVYTFTGDLIELNDTIETRITDLNESSKDIFNSTNEQKVTNDELLKAVGSINLISQKTAENAELLHRAAFLLSGSSEKMSASVSKFNI